MFCGGGSTCRRRVKASSVDFSPNNVSISVCKSIWDWCHLYIYILGLEKMLVSACKQVTKAAEKAAEKAAA